MKDQIEQRRRENQVKKAQLVAKLTEKKVASDAKKIEKEMIVEARYQQYQKSKIVMAATKL